jgi:hypothetical protein
MLVRAGLFAAPASAGGAATLYAEPGGNGAMPCTPADPCEIQNAIETLAPTGATVILLPGTYVLGAADGIGIANNVDVDGQGDAADVILQSAADIPVHVAFASTSSTLSDVTIEHTTSGVATTIGLQVEGGTAERVFVESQGNYACYVSGLIRDSACANTSSSGGVGAGLFNSVDLTGKLRNVTAVATSSTGFGLFMAATASGTDLVLDGRNVIAQGNTDIGGTGTAGSTAALNLSYSNFGAVEFGDFTGTATGTLNTVNDNQGTSPLLDANYRQMSGSPTIDAGDPLADLLGAGDIDGDTRVQNSTPDIGADESDGVVPDTEITKNPPKRTKRRTAVFEFESEEPSVDFDCKIDGKPFKPCDSGAVKYKRLARKKHTFQVRADDGFNVDATPDKYTWKIRKKKK